MRGSEECNGAPFSSVDGLATVKLRAMRLDAVFTLGSAACDLVRLPRRPGAPA